MSHKKSSVVTVFVCLWAACCLVRLSKGPPGYPQPPTWCLWTAKVAKQSAAAAAAAATAATAAVVVVFFFFFSVTCQALGIFYKKNLTRFMQQQLKQWTRKIRASPPTLPHNKHPPTETHTDASPRFQLTHTCSSSVPHSVVPPKLFILFPFSCQSFALFLSFYHCCPFQTSHLFVLASYFFSPYSGS